MSYIYYKLRITHNYGPAFMTSATRLWKKFMKQLRKQKVKTAPGIAHVADRQGRARPPQTATVVIGQLPGQCFRGLAGMHEFNGPEGSAGHRG